VFDDCCRIIVKMCLLYMCVNCVIYVLIVYETDWKVETGAGWSTWKHLFSVARL
jgi:hypothetical protein